MKLDELSWDQLVQLEPMLLHHYNYAKHADSSPGADGFCGQRYWYNEVKPALVQIVGWLRWDRHPILSTSAAYDIAYHKILSAVPPCRNCQCCW